ncbi:MAG: hypothetical protein ABI771_17955 [Betaproteobacteria bacterium]
MKASLRKAGTLIAGVLLVARFVSGYALAQDNAASLDAKLVQLRGEIVGLVGPASCANLVNCRIAALGVDACGGAAGYIAYSWLSTEKDALETKIAEYNFTQEDALKASHAVGACVVKPEPVAACVNRRCVVSGSQ